MLGIDGFSTSPDERSLASGSLDSTLQVWNATNGNPVWTSRYNGSGSAPVTAVAWSPYGHRLASASLDQTIQIWQPG